MGRASNAYRLPDTVSDVAAGCIDPLMVAYHAVRKSGIRLHDRVLVVGSGIIGQLIGELAKKAGASYVALSKVSDVKVARAKELGIFDAYFDGNDPQREALLKGATQGGFDLAFEAVGAEEALATCLDGVRPGGEDRHDRQLRGAGGLLCHEPGGAPGDPAHWQRLLYPEGV